MIKNPVKQLKLAILLAIIMGLVFVIPSVNAVQYSNTSSGTDIINGNPELIVCNALASLGMGCNSTPKVNLGISSSSSGLSNSSSESNKDLVAEQTDGQEQNVSLQAFAAGAVIKRSVSSDKVILLKIKADFGLAPTIGLDTNEAIFEIIKGQRHFIPTVDIFFDYSFKLNTVQNATIQDIYKFPRAKSIKVRGDNKRAYYVTEGYMIRPMINKEVFNSYGNREEDTVVISEKEFSFYPRNQFVFVENLSDSALQNYGPIYSVDIFQITSDGIKRYIVPQAVKKMRIRSDQIAPVNKIELDSYSYGNPIIF